MEWTTSNRIFVYTKLFLTDLRGHLLHPCSEQSVEQYELPELEGYFAILKYLITSIQLVQTDKRIYETTRIFEYLFSLEKCPCLMPRSRVHSTRWLIEHYNLRSSDQCNCQRQLTLLTTCALKVVSILNSKNIPERVLAREFFLQSILSLSSNPLASVSSNPRPFNYIKNKPCSHTFLYHKCSVSNLEIGKEDEMFPKSESIEQNIVLRTQTE